MNVLRVALLTSSMLIPALAMAAPAAPTALPTGPSVVAGQATVSRSGSALVVTETSDKAILNWQSFDIGAVASVTFAQPGAGAIALNRVLSADPSHIDGALRANGQIVLINPNGLVFGAGATVNVGGLIASSLDISDASFLNGDLVFNRTGPGGAVVNNGSIRAANGGYVALLGSQLANRGMIQANFGTVAMAAGDRVTMTLAGGGLVGISVDPAAVKAQIDQGGAIVAGDGSVWLSAKAQSALLSGAINATGSIEANSLTAKGGSIVLDATGPITLTGANVSATGAAGGGNIKTGGLDNASTSIGQGSVLDASATVSGPGGSVETSGQTLSIGQTTVRTAGAGGGAAGSWLLDPYDLTINTAAAATIDTALATSGVTIQTSASSSTGAGVVNTSGSGDIVVAAPIAWSANTTLTLNAYHSVIANAAITAGGATSGLVIVTNDGGSGGQLTFAAPVSLPTTGSVTINSATYTLINSVSGLQAIGLTGNYALVGGVNLGSTSGFTPLDSAGFTGKLEGLGNTISGLTITASTAPNVGLFGMIGVGGLVENLVLTGASVSQGVASGPSASTTGGSAGAGVLAGENDGTIYNVSSSGSVTANGFILSGSIEGSSDGGGLVGFNTGTIDHSSSSATVTGSVTGPLGNNNGGLVGVNYAGLISNSHATGAVTGGPAGPDNGVPSLGGYAGGLVGENANDSNSPAVTTIINSYATGSVTGGSAPGDGGLGGAGAAGGLAGENDGSISGSYATGATTGGTSTGRGLGGAAGGLIGFNAGALSNSYSTGSATGGAGLSTGAGGSAGGLIGYNDGDVIDTYATGFVTGGLHSGVSASTGGLVGTGIVGAGSVYGNYWNITTSGQTTDLETGHVNTSGPPSVTGLTTVQWLTQGPGVSGSASGWDFAGTWLQGYPYPVLKGLPYITVNAGAAGTYGGTLAISSGVTATDQNGANALSLINIGGMTVIGGSTAAVTTLTDLGAAGAVVTAPSAYQIVYAPVSATINPASLTYSVANASSTYGTLATSGAATLSGFIGGDATSVTGTVGINDGVNSVTLAANTSARSYNETVTGLAGAKAADYVIAGAGNTVGMLTINSLALTLTGSRAYNGSTAIAGSALSATNLIGSDSVTIGGSGALAAKDAGSEAIASTAGLTLSNSNYTLAGATGSVTISALAVTLTGSRAYNGSTTLSGSALGVTGLISGDSMTITGSATLAAKDAGLEAIISTTGITLSNADYILTGPPGSAIISPLAVTLSGSRAYDGSTAIGAGSLSIGDLVSGDSLSLNGSATLAAKDAGSEAIASTAGLTLSNANYTLIGATGSVTISPLTVTLNGSRIYDGSATIAGAALSASGLIGGDSLTFGGSAALAAKDVGSEAIVSTTGLTLSSPNYILASAAGSVTINPALLTITANDLSILAGVSPTFTVDYSGFLGGDTASLVRGLSIAANGAAAPGAYAIIPSGAMAPNYNVAYVDGVLTIQAGQASQTSPSAPAAQAIASIVGSSGAATSPRAGIGAPVTGDGASSSGTNGAVVLLNPDGGPAAILLTANQPIGSDGGVDNTGLITP